MFELSQEEFDDLRYQFGTSNRGGTRYKPIAFTEQGVAMLSSVLKSRRAIKVNILIMRAFVRLRGMMSSDKELLRKLEEMEMKYDEQFRVVFEVIRQLMTPADPPRKRIGFEAKEAAAPYGKGGKEEIEWSEPRRGAGEPGNREVPMRPGVSAPAWDANI